MAIRSETRTTHTITIDLPDDVIGKIQYGDDVEVIFNSSAANGRMPRPTRLSYGMINWVMGWAR